METKISLLTTQIGDDLKNGVFGVSGSLFLSTRQLASRYDISIDSAVKIMNELCHQRLLHLQGKHYYITTGYASPKTPYGKFLFGKQKKILGMIVNKLDNPFISVLTEEICRSAAESGYTLIVSCSNHQMEKEAEIIDTFVTCGASGIFVCPDSELEMKELYAQCPLPVISIGRELDIPNCDSILVDNYTAGQLVAGHLWEIGCTKYLYVGLRKNRGSDSRLNGFSDKLAMHGFILKEDDILSVDYYSKKQIDVGAIIGNIYYVMKNLSETEKLGIFCYHDLLATSILQKIKQNNHSGTKVYRIPNDIAIVGFDDLSIASLISPSLTTVSYNFVSIANQSMTIMLDFIRNPEHRPQKYEIYSTLSIRESTMKIMESES